MADAGPEGEARLRLPYPTEPSGGAWAERPYRVQAGAASGLAYVGDAQVKAGEPVRVELTAAGPRESTP
jgi:hypothetical protein